MAPIDRRQILAGTAAFSALALGFPIGPTWARARSSITIAITRDLQGALDPAMRVSSQEGNVLRAVCPGLVRFRPGTFEWEPDLAERIEQTSDTVISFALKPGLMFHDGFGEVTAEDVKFSFERFRRPGPDGRPVSQEKDWEALDRVEIIGKHEGRIILKRPSPALWKVTLPDVSGCVISQKAFEAGAYRSDRQPVKVVGAGPYLFAEWRPNERVVLRADPSWKGPKPGFEEIILRPIRDPKTTELALRADEIQFAAIEPAALEPMAKAPETRTLKQDSINYVWIGMNVEKKPLDDPRVRRAIRAAVDVDQVIEGAYDGAVSRAFSPIAPGLLGHWADAPRHVRDVGEARNLLAEAGHATPRLRLTFLNRPAYQNAGIILQAQLAEAGILLELEPLDSGAFWSMGGGEQGRGLDLSLQRFGGKADPAFQMQWFVSEQVGLWNWQRWKSPDFDALFTKAGAVLDETERARMYVEMQKLMDESSAFIWLTHEVNTFAYRDWLAPAILPNGDDMLYDRFSAA